jgi:hypothetical protein
MFDRARFLCRDVQALSFFVVLIVHVVYVLVVRVVLVIVIVNDVLLSSFNACWLCLCLCLCRYLCVQMRHYRGHEEHAKRHNHVEVASLLADSHPHAR